MEEQCIQFYENYFAGNKRMIRAFQKASQIAPRIQKIDNGERLLLYWNLFKNDDIWSFQFRFNEEGIYMEIYADGKFFIANQHFE